VSITEVTGMEGEVVTTQEVYRFKRRGITPEGKIIGQFEATGVRPMFTDRLRVSGIELPARMFEGVD
jgi:pilus assembly protein CpaF